MMKNIFTFLVLLGCGLAHSQSVGIGTKTPDSSAALDIDVSGLGKNAKKGLLVPRVALASTKDKTTVANPAAGLVVYNTATTITGTNDVVADMFYFWNGTLWTDMANYEVELDELQPLVYFLRDSNNQPLNASNLTGAGEVVTYSGATELMNAGNIVTRNTANNTFTINYTGIYELSGMIFYNPTDPPNTTAPTDLEFLFQKLHSATNTWTNIAETVSVWGAGTRANSRSMIIAPYVVNLSKNDLIRALVKTNVGTPTSPAINSPTGFNNYSKSLKIQKFD